MELFFPEDNLELMVLSSGSDGVYIVCVQYTTAGPVQGNIIQLNVGYSS